MFGNNTLTKTECHRWYEKTSRGIPTLRTKQRLGKLNIVHLKENLYGSKFNRTKTQVLTQRNLMHR